MSKRKDGQARGQYTLEFKLEAVRLVKGGQAAPVTAKILGTSENAVKSQVWCAIATYVLIAIVKKELQLDASLYTWLQILSVSVFEKTDISCTLQADDYKHQPSPSANQLILFGF